MKIENQYIYGGNQQYADVIINSSPSLSNTDRRLIDLIYSNTDNEEERKALLKSLETIKSESADPKEKEKSKGMLKKFFESGVAEAGKQLAKEVVEGGFEMFV